MVIEMDPYQITFLAIGGGAGLGVIKLVHSQGKFRQEVEDFKAEYARDRKDDERRIGILERLVIYNRLERLEAGGAVVRNSPLAIPELAEHLKQIARPHPAIVRGFKKVLQKPLADSDALVMADFSDAVGQEMLEERARLWANSMNKDAREGEKLFGWSEYMTYCLVVLKEAERDGDGGEKVLAKLGVMPEPVDDGA